jgi:hypothetical protein
MTRSLVPPPEPNVALTLCPVARSKSGIICSTAALMPPGATRVTSTARATSQLPMVIMAMANNSTYFMVFLPVGDLRPAFLLTLMKSILR